MSVSDRILAAIARKNAERIEEDRLLEAAEKEFAAKRAAVATDMEPLRKVVIQGLNELGESHEYAFLFGSRKIAYIMPDSDKIRFSTLLEAIDFKGPLVITSINKGDYSYVLDICNDGDGYPSCTATILEKNINGELQKVSETSWTAAHPEMLKEMIQEHFIEFTASNSMLLIP